MSMNVFAQQGHKVRCVSLNSNKRSGLDIASEHLKIGEIYTVYYTDVFSGYADVVLEELLGYEFDSELFIDVELQAPELDRLHSDYTSFYMFYQLC